MLRRNFLWPLAVMALAIAAAPASTLGAEQADRAISLADGKLTLSAPESWAKKEPKFAGITLYEFAAPAAEGDKIDGRVTIGPAGGGVDANQQRWLAQFSHADNSPVENQAKPASKQVAGCTVHRLDVAGTYQGPRFAPGAASAKQPGYRMLAAIIEVPDKGAFYVRVYGPEKTIDKHAADFEKMIDGLKVK